MPLITIVNDPANISDRDSYPAPEGTILADWLIEHYGADGFVVPTEVYVGSIAESCLVNVGDFEAVNVPLHDPVFIVSRPQGTEIIVGIIVAIVAAVAVAVLMPIPDFSNVGGRQARRSPNNALSGQTNIARLLDRVPDIFGQVTSYPDLIAPTVTEFRNHIKFQIEYLCIGRGWHDLEDVRSGDTPLTQIPGANFQEYPPNIAPTLVWKTRQSNEVSGQELKGPNETVAVAPDSFFTVAYASGFGTGAVANTLGGTTWDGIVATDIVSIVDLYGEVGGTFYNLDGTYTVLAVTASTLSLQNPAAVNANWTQFDGLTEQVEVIVNNVPVSPLIALPNSVAPVGPFIVPGDNNSEIWFDLQAPKGLAQGERLNQVKGVALSMFFEQIDENDVSTGSNFTVAFSVGDDTRDPRFWTFKIGSAHGMIPFTRYRMTAERTAESDPTNIQILEEIRWTRLVGMENITAPDTTGTTRIVITTQATEQVAALQERKFNLKATRQTVTWDGNQVVGNIENGAGLAPSRRFADAFLHYLLDQDLGARTLSALDVDALYAVQDSLDAVFDGTKGEFSFTFDGADTPALEELRQIALAARCFVFREGSVFSVTRDEAQPVSRGLFNRRSKKPDSETRRVRFNRPLDHDGVTLEYSDIDDNEKRVITLPDDLPVTDPHATLLAAINPLKIEAAGIRQYVQAWDRVQYEFRRQIYRRVTVESTVSAEGVLVPLNGRVQHVDGSRLTTLLSNGEVSAVDGLTVTTTQRCLFDAELTYSVVLRDDTGTPGTPIAVTARPDTEFGFILSAAPSFAIVVRGDNDYQRGTLYSFGPDGNELAEAYLVQRKQPDGDRNVRFEMINYTIEYFAADNDTPPDKVTL